MLSIKPRFSFLFYCFPICGGKNRAICNNRVCIAWTRPGARERGENAYGCETSERGRLRFLVEAHWKGQKLWGNFARACLSHGAAGFLRNFGRDFCQGADDTTVEAALSEPTGRHDCSNNRISSTRVSAFPHVVHRDKREYSIFPPLYIYWNFFTQSQIKTQSFISGHPLCRPERTVPCAL